ncbi:BTB/POZ domain-containing protein 19 isoform X2 [Rhineura floridana]|uniref:BTB/POZ domain-containing protein 19 isoform X2 n=1 Tax=Rhineura floridana TaxID=261503 RepID=UPI002AC823BC|nr:BTB/POZ domain-containing protein 19 isoform X2 [Rhineura floridana]
MASSCSALLLGDSAAFAAALRTLINNPQFSDVTFLVGREQQEIFAHRCLLSSRCQALHAMLSQPQEIQAPLILSHVQPEVFLAVIEYLYTNSVTLNSIITLEVLTSSIEYGLDELRKLCIEFIKDTLSVEQACEAFQAAVAYGQVDLQMHCLAFIENFTRVVQTRGFLELSELAMQTILHSDCLAIDEVKLIRAVREWAHVGSAVLDRTVSDVAAAVVPGLRLALLSASELTTLEEENRKDQMIPKVWLRPGRCMHYGRGVENDLPCVDADVALCPGNIIATLTHSTSDMVSP